MLKTWLSKSPSNARFIECEAAERRRKKELFEYKKTVETKAKEKMRQALQERRSEVIFESHSLTKQVPSTALHK